MSLDSLASLSAAPLWAWWYARCVGAGAPRRFFLGHALCTAGQLLAAAVATSVVPVVLHQAQALVVVVPVSSHRS